MGKEFRTLPDGADDPLLRDALQRLGPDDLAPESRSAVRVAPSEFFERLRSDSRGRSRYSIREEIGRGAMGVVHRVHDSEIGRPVAMKVLRREVSDPGLLQRFIEEAQVTGQLDHPGIVSVHDMGVDDHGMPYFTMQLVRGRDLSQILGDPDSGWSVARGLQVVLRVAETIAFAHARGVIHRDLKPANVMVGRFGEVQVMDWGIARLMDNLGAGDGSTSRVAPTTVIVPPGSGDDAARTREGTVLGTPSFMAPEQAAGQPADSRSDIYSLGAIIYQLVTGVAPFTDTVKGGAAIIVAVREAGPTPIDSLASDVPAEVVAICEKAMSRDPGERYSSASRLADDVRAFLEGRVVAAYRTGGVVELRMWAHRNRLAAGLSGLLVLVVGLAAWLTGALAVESQARAHALDLFRVSSYSLWFQELERGLHSIWPSNTNSAAELRSWIEDVNELQRASISLQARLNDRFPEHDQTLALARDRSRYDLLQRSISHPGVEYGMAMEERLRIAEELSDHFNEGRERLAHAWDEAFAANSQRGGNSIPAGFIPPFGLEPIGPDSQSGLHEFVHLATGDVPSRDPVTHELRLEDTTGVIFVLIPAGRSPGGVSRDPDSSVYLPLAEGDAFPIYRYEPVASRELIVTDNLISKYEMTQAQWVRWTGFNPSGRPAGTTSGTRVVSGLHPVENVSWKRSVEVLSRFGASLPTEVESEYATRARTTTCWWTGNDATELIHRENHLDKSGADARDYVERVDAYLELDDGWPDHAPVNWGAPNAFGLVNVHGNVIEFCLSLYPSKFMASNALSDDPFSHPEIKRVIRGGSFAELPDFAGSASRSARNINDVAPSIGFRPSFPLYP